MSFFEVLPNFHVSDHGPLYLQLGRALREAILDGSLADNDVLPTERELASQYQISRMTVRKALRDLEVEGLLMRRQGSGTFVAPRCERNLANLSSFSEDMMASGRQSQSVWIRREAGWVTPDESMSLGLSPGAGIYRFQRIRQVDDRPVAIETSVVPAYCLPSELAVEDSLYAALKATGHRPVRALQRLRAVLLQATEAGLLGVEPGSAGLFIERRGFLRDGRTAEFTIGYYSGDASDMVSELTIPSETSGPPASPHTTSRAAKPRRAPVDVPVDNDMAAMEG